MKEFSSENTFFSWIQLINALTCTRKINVLEIRRNSSNLCVYHNYLSKNSQIYVVNKVNSKELYI